MARQIRWFALGGVLSSSNSVWGDINEIHYLGDMPTGAEHLGVL